MTHTIRRTIGYPALLLSVLAQVSGAQQPTASVTEVDVTDTTITLVTHLVMITRNAGMTIRTDMITLTGTGIRTPQPASAKLSPSG